MDNAWEAVNRRLVSAMLSLDLYDSLIVGDRVEPPRRGFLKQQSRPVPRRFVQITASRTTLVAECVGSPSIGGDWPMSTEQEQTLLRQGWQKPWSDTMHTFQREASVAAVPRLALVTVRALELLGCDATQLQYDRTREEP